MSSDDYDYGRSSGHNQAAVLVSIEGMKSGSVAVQAFASRMLQMLGDRADEITAEVRDREAVTA